MPSDVVHAGESALTSRRRGPALTRSLFDALAVVGQLRAGPDRH